MSEITLYKSPKKALRLLGLCSLFVLPGCYLIYKGRKYLPFIASIGFFGLGYIIGFFHLFDKSPQITISSKGIWDTTLKLDIIPWHSIYDAYTLTINKQAFICLVTNEEVTGKKIHKLTRMLNEGIEAQKVNLNLSAVKADPNIIISLIVQLINEPQEGRSGLINTFKKTT